MADKNEAPPSRWKMKAAWLEKLTPEERAFIESLPTYDDDLAEGETEVVFVPPRPTKPPAKKPD
jgi:hypothetical protein